MDLSPPNSIVSRLYMTVTKGWESDRRRNDLEYTQNL
ncbi:uncharacterized protein METZ01_LOCUS508455, partial [marine metagenome]